LNVFVLNGLFEGMHVEHTVSLGVYSSRELAEAARQRYLSLLANKDEFDYDEMLKEEDADELAELYSGIHEFADYTIVETALDTAEFFKTYYDE